MADMSIQLTLLIVLLHYFYTIPFFGVKAIIKSKVLNGRHTNGR